MSLEKDVEQVPPPREEQHRPVASTDLGSTLSAGMRVRLDGAPIKRTLATPLGTIITEAPWGTYIVRLDSPATDHNGDGTNQQLTEIRVLGFNLLPIT